MTTILQNDEMLTREQLVAHFTNDYKQSGFYTNEEIEKILKKRTTEDLQKTYNFHMEMKKEKKEILQNGVKLFNISYNNYGQEETDGKQLIDFMRKNRMYSYDDGIDYRLQVGGDIIIGIPEKFINKIKNNFPHVSIIKHTSILGKKDIEQFKVNDKVKIITNSIFGKESDQGTVTFIEDGEIIIRKYRARKNGYSFMAGDEVQLIKIDKF